MHKTRVPLYTVHQTVTVLLHGFQRDMYLGNSFLIHFLASFDEAPALRVFDCHTVQCICHVANFGRGWFLLGMLNLVVVFGLVQYCAVARLEVGTSNCWASVSKLLLISHSARFARKTIVSSSKRLSTSHKFHAFPFSLHNAPLLVRSVTYHSGTFGHSWASTTCPLPLS